MRLFVLIALGVYAQEGDYDYGTEAPPATEAVATEAPAPETEAPTQEPLPVPDYVAEEEAEAGEDEPEMANDYTDYNSYDSYDPYANYEPYEDPYEATSAPFNPAAAGARNGGGSGTSISRLALSLLPNGDFEFTWDYNADHVSYSFEFQELIGNYQNSTDFVTFNAGSVAMTTDGITTTSTLTPDSANTVYRWLVTPFATGPTAGASQTIDGQSYTSGVVHQPGDVYEGGGGYGGQVLLPTDFTGGDFVTTTASDTVGYVIAVLVQFPAGCPGIDVAADVDGNYIYTDPAISDNHRIFVFPETHFSNQFSGAIKSFHYYVSGAAYAGCDLSDPGASVSVSLANNYILRTDETADIDLNAMWPSDSSYPPVEYTEQHTVNLTDYIQPATHIGPSRAVSAPRIYFSTNTCDVTLNVEAGTSPGWGMLNAFNSNLDMTDLWVNPPTSNTGTDFNLQALIWLTQVGVTLRYDTSVVGCETITVSGYSTFLEIDPSYNLVIATPPAG